MYNQVIPSCRQSHGLCGSRQMDALHPLDSLLAGIETSEESPMFSYEEICKFNETDMSIYKYIVSNVDKIQYMTIRELAGALSVSTSTILRFCSKNNFDGYSEFERTLKKELSAQNTPKPLADLQELSGFFARTNSGAFEKKLLFAVDAIRKSDLTIFIGMGPPAHWPNTEKDIFPIWDILRWGWKTLFILSRLSIVKIPLLLPCQKVVKPGN